MSKFRYALLDQASLNELGHFDALAEAVESRARFVAAAPEAADDLEIWDQEDDVLVELEPERRRPAPAA